MQEKWEGVEGSAVAFSDTIELAFRGFGFSIWRDEFPTTHHG
jgi:hypothetical protein